MALASHHPSNRWLVLGGVSVILFLKIGILKSYGVLIEYIARDLRISTGLVGMAVGLSHGLSAVFAFVNPPLLRRFSTRQLVMTGSIFGALGFTLTAFAQSGLHFVLALVMSGLSYTIVLFPAVVSPVDYFPDSFAVAMSLVMAGGGAGMMLLPVVTDQLVQIYGWRGATLILGGLSAHGVVCGALIKPFKPHIAESAAEREDCPLLGKSDTASMAHESIDVTTMDPELIIHQSADIADTDASTGIHLQRDKNRTLVSESTTNNVNSTDVDVIKEVIDEDVMPEASQETLVGCWKTATRILNFMAVTFDLRLFVEYPSITAVVIALFLHGVSYNGWIIFVVPNAIAKGYTSSQAVFLATIGGAANVLGRLTIGFFSSKELISDELSFGILCGFAAAAFLSNTVASAYYLLAILSAVNGFTVGAKTTMLNLLPKSTVPNDRVVAVISLLFVAVGFGEPIGGALMGKGFDLTHSYDVPFAIAGGTDILSAAILLIPWLCRRCQRREMAPV